MEFICDVNLMDRETVLSNQNLVKTWRLRNTGSVAWPQGTKVIFIRGDRILLTTEEEFPVAAAAGQTTDVSVFLRTPPTPGHYTAHFQLADVDRVHFGSIFWVDLYVQNPKIDTKDTKQDTKQDVKHENKQEAKAIFAASPITPNLTTPAQADPVTKALISPTPVEAAPAEVVQTSPMSYASAIAHREAKKVNGNVTKVGVGNIVNNATSGKYNQELQTLVTMGFTDTRTCIYLLERHHGDMTETIQWLLLPKQ